MIYYERVQKADGVFGTDAGREEMSSEGTLSLFQRKVLSEMSVSTVRVEEPLYLMCDTTSYDLESMNDLSMTYPSL